MNEEVSIKPEIFRSDSTMRLENKNILITGVAKGGIGEALLQELMENNNLIIVSKNLSSERFPEVQGFKIDCTKELEINKLEDHISNTIGTLDILINCVGGSLGSRSIESIDQAFFEEVLAVNLTSAFLLTQMASRLLENGGSIVHIVSSSAFEPEINKIPYSVAKAGLVHLIRIMAISLAPRNIRINGVSPTYVFTDRHKEELRVKAEKEGIMYNESISQKIKKQLLKTPLLPENLVEMVKFAATTEIMTGKVLHATLGRIT